MSKLDYTLPEAKPESEKDSEGFTVNDGPFETTSKAGQLVRWAIITRQFKNGPSDGILRVEGIKPKAQPVELGRSKLDRVKAALADIAKRNI